MTPWTKFATSFYKNKKRQNKNYKFSQALTDAAALYNGGNDIVGGGDDEVVKQNGGGGKYTSEAMNLIENIILPKNPRPEDVIEAKDKLNKIDIDVKNYLYNNIPGAREDDLKDAKEKKEAFLEKKLQELNLVAKAAVTDRPLGQGRDLPVRDGYEEEKGSAQGEEEANGGKKDKKSAKKGKKSAKKGKKSVKKGGKKGKKSAKKGKC